MVQPSLYGDPWNCPSLPCTTQLIQMPICHLSSAPDTYSPGKTSQDYIIRIIVASILLPTQGCKPMEPSLYRSPRNDSWCHSSLLGTTQRIRRSMEPPINLWNHRSIHGTTGQSMELPIMPVNNPTDTDAHETSHYPRYIYTRYKPVNTSHF